MVESQYCSKFVLRQMYRKMWFLHYKTFYFGKTSRCKKNYIKEKPNFFAISPVAFAPRTQTYVTELKEWTIATPSSTREEESITSYSSFSLGWGLLLATGIDTRYKEPLVLRLIRRMRVIELKQLAQGCKQTWQWRESNPQPSDHESKMSTTVGTWNPLI
jgi:hypothetical protein